MKKIILSATLIGACSLAFAQPLPSGNLAQQIWDWFIGNWAVWIVTFAIVGTGIMCLTNRLEWKFFFYVLFGSVLLFGAKKFADQLKTWATTDATPIEQQMENNIASHQFKIDNFRAG